MRAAHPIGDAPARSLGLLRIGCEAALPPAEVQEVISHQHSTTGTIAAALLSPAAVSGRAGTNRAPGTGAVSDGLAMISDRAKTLGVSAKTFLPLH
jgi:hypothetical protein